MDIGIFGTGNLAIGLGRAWGAAGLSVAVAGRNRAHAVDAAGQIGGSVRVVEPAELAASKVLLIAVPFDGLAEAVALLGGPDGARQGSGCLADPRRDAALGRRPRRAGRSPHALRPP